MPKPPLYVTNVVGPILTFVVGSAMLMLWRYYALICDDSIDTWPFGRFSM